MQTLSMYLKLFTPQPGFRIEACSNRLQLFAAAKISRLVQTTHYQVVEAQHPSVPVEAHGCCGALCLTMAVAVGSPVTWRPSDKVL